MSGREREWERVREWERERVRERERERERERRRRRGQLSDAMGRTKKGAEKEQKRSA